MTMSLREEVARKQRIAVVHGIGYTIAFGATIAGNLTWHACPPVISMLTGGVLVVMLAGISVSVQAVLAGRKALRAYDASPHLAYLAELSHAFGNDAGNSGTEF